MLPGVSLHWFCGAKGGDRVVEPLVEIHSPFTLQTCVSPTKSEQLGLGKNQAAEYTSKVSRSASSSHFSGNTSKTSGQIIY